jgi:hypothetical protein
MKIIYPILKIVNTPRDWSLIRDVAEHPFVAKELTEYR